MSEFIYLKKSYENGSPLSVQPVWPLQQSASVLSNEKPPISVPCTNYSDMDSNSHFSPSSSTNALKSSILSPSSSSFISTTTCRNTNVELTVTTTTIGNTNTQVLASITNNNILVSSSLTNTSGANNETSDIKRLQSMQEMRENERRRREDIAGKIDMYEQHKLMAQFEQNL
jgi:hypothetical protein